MKFKTASSGNFDRTVSIYLSAAAIIVLSVVLFTRRVAAQGAVSDLTVHEWGTFTSVAGNDGKAVEWLPQVGSIDLPQFVEHFRNTGFKSALRGTIRMETPVLYFYSPHRVQLSVDIGFSKGLITEWYPHASRVAPAGNLNEVSLAQGKANGHIYWDSVQVEPGNAAAFPQEVSTNHYYAARTTAAAPLRVSAPGGEQREKFLFYRGVAAFQPPLSATVNGDGSILVKNGTPSEIPEVILFERRGNRIGYRISKAIQGEASLTPAELNGNLDSLCADLEVTLREAGLYADEAHAMVSTWRSSWFEEGSRLLYLVPRSFVDNVLPLNISPAPSQIARVFVGRVEIVSPATQNDVRTAALSHDYRTLAKYGRFLEPIARTIMERDPARAKELSEALNGVYQVAQQ